MLKPSADLIIPPEQSRYSLVVAVAKRARQIAGEAESRGEILVEKPVDLAVQDFKQHKCRVIEQPIENDDDLYEDTPPADVAALEGHAGESEIPEQETAEAPAQEEETSDDSGEENA